MVINGEFCSTEMSVIEMSSNMDIRAKIIHTIQTTVEELDFVNAMWQVGAAAFNRIDQWSDIDIVLDVIDDQVLKVFPHIDSSLTTIYPIEYEFLCQQPLSEGANQKSYKLQGVSEYLVIEVCAVKHSATEKFLDSKIHSDILVSFDKCGVTQSKGSIEKDIDTAIRERLQRLNNFFHIYQFLIKKEINRGNALEAAEYFRIHSVAHLLELLRIKYSPTRFDFNTRYAYYDLPHDIVKRLERYYFIKDIEDLRRKHIEVVEWFDELMREVSVE